MKFSTCWRDKSGGKPPQSKAIVLPVHANSGLARNIVRRWDEVDPGVEEF